MRLHGRVTALWEFLGSDAFVADSLLLVNRFFWMQRRKIRRAHDRPRPRFRLTLLSDLVCILSLRGRPGEYVFEESPPDKGACTFTKPVIFKAPGTSTGTQRLHLPNVRNRRRGYYWR